MKKLGIALILVLLPLSTYAQDKTKDQKAVEAAILGYIENFFTNDYESMEKHLHDQLSKRGINQDGRLNEPLSKSKLKALMQNKQPLPLSQQSNTVDNIFIDRNFASAILSTGYPSVKWKEYVHLAKLEGKWLVMDVFWNFDE